MKGAAFATALSQSIGGIAIFIAAMHNPLLTVTGGLLRPKWTILKDCIRVSMPLVGQRMVMGCGYVVFFRTGCRTWNAECGSTFNSVNHRTSFLCTGIWDSNSSQYSFRECDGQEE